MKAKLVPNLLLAAGLLAALGCGKPLSTVSGTVSYEGQPVDKGIITFIPADGKGPTCGGPIAQGAFHVPDVAPGKKMVQIVGLKEINYTREQMNTPEAKKMADPSGMIERADTIPANAVGNNSIVDVPDGNSTFNFALKKPATAEKGK